MIHKTPYETRYIVRTPEQAEFEFSVAGLVSRVFAVLIDSLVLAALFSVVAIITSSIAILSTATAHFLLLVGIFVVQWGYFVVLEMATGGQSIGKRLLRLRVIRTDGMRISFFHSVIRNLFRALDSLPLFYVVGGITAYISGLSQRLGDLAAGTIIVREKRRIIPETVVPPSQRYNSFVEDPRVIRAVRQRVSAKEREILLSLALRREEIELGARLDLFSHAAALLSQRLGLPKPPFFSDEKFVLNLTAVAVETMNALRPLARRTSPHSKTSEDGHLTQ